jgi:putative cardiolipin synthase
VAGVIAFRLPALALFLGLVLLAAGCATLPEGFERPTSYALEDTNDTILGVATRKRLAEHPDKEAGFRPLSSGIEALTARAVLAQLAERSIDAQYYLLHDDLTGWYFIYELLRAADRGVRVRLLVDDMAIPGRDPQIAAFAAHPNIEVRVFNPFSRNAPRTTQYVTRFGSVTRRMHNKSFTVDNQVTILGGRNIGDEYFEANPAVAYGDMDVILIGPPVHSVSASFDQYWNSDLSYPISVLFSETPSQADIEIGREKLAQYIERNRNSAYAEALRTSDLANELRGQGELDYFWGDAVVVYDEPGKVAASREKKSLHLLPKLRPFFDRLNSELILIAAYFVPGRDGTDYLTGLSKRGVRVRILTNSLAATDVTAVHAGYARYRKALLKAGIELYEMKPTAVTDVERRERQKKTAGFAGSSKASLHAKSFVLDREEVFIGSLNLDPRSANENTEIGVVMDNRRMAEGVARWFDDNIDRIAYRVKLCGKEDDCSGLRWYEQRPDGKTRVYDADPHTSLWRRIKVNLLRLLPFESQL